MVVSLNDLEEDSWPVLHGLREDLQKIAIVIIINQNLQFLKLCQVLLNLKSFKYINFLDNFLRVYLDFRVRKTLSKHVIIRVWNVEEFLPPCPQVCDSFDYVM